MVSLFIFTIIDDVVSPLLHKYLVDDPEVDKVSWVPLQTLVSLLVIIVGNAVTNTLTVS